MPLLSVVITTWNSEVVLENCLASVSALAHSPIEIIVIDNASQDRTGEILKRYEDRFTVILNDTNRGFAAAQNQGIRASRGEWVLSLNPDVIVTPDFVSQLLAVSDADPRVGTICGKLLRWMPAAQDPRSRVLDSTGIYFKRNLRHLDRGSGQIDLGQFDRPEFVFGATGAAALYRRSMIDDISVHGEFFDEDFFAYREDADVAWRAQIMGWRCIYTPEAVAWHVRRVTPERFGRLPHAINWHSVKNRFLMRAKNISGWLYRRLFVPVTVRDLMIGGYALLRDWRFFTAFWHVWTHRGALKRNREWIQQHRRVSDHELARWFQDVPASEPCAPAAVVKN
jgi:GT2 family glycosyltransferase